MSPTGMQFQAKLPPKEVRGVMHGRLAGLGIDGRHFWAPRVALKRFSASRFRCIEDLGRMFGTFTLLPKCLLSTANTSRKATGMSCD